MPKFYDSALDQGLTYERCESFGNGFDADTRNTLLPPDAYQYALNVSVPENLVVRTRAGADRIATNLGQKTQGLLYFDIPGVEQVITAVGGTLYYTDSNLSAWTTMTGYSLQDGDVRFSAAQGVDKMLITDGTTFRIWTGSAWEAALTTTATDPPTGATILLWHAGRMWAAGFPGTGGAGKEDDAICVSNLLSFGAGQWDLTDRSFRVGKGEGDPIMGLASIPASTPGEAVLGVLKQNSIHLVRTVPTDAVTNYSDSVNPESVSSGLGVVGKRAFDVTDNDLLFVATDKSFRSLRRMEGAGGQYELSTPLSKPLQPYIDRINWTLQHLIAVKRYRQFVLFSVPLDNATYPDTVFVWSIRLQRWLGIWTGWTPNCWEVSRFSGQVRLLHGDNLGNVRMWKDFADQTADATYKDDGTGYASKLWTRSLLFGEPLNDKDGYYCETRFGASGGVVNHTLVGDGGAELRSWSRDLRPTEPTLPITLPFFLTNPNDTPVRRGLRSLTPFNSCYIRVESTDGWWELRSVSMAAFVNSLATA